MAELENRVDDCFSGDQSANLRTELAEADQDYHGITVSDEDNASTSSESDNDTPPQAMNELPHLSPEKSEIDACEATKLEQFCIETCKCKLGAKGTPCSSTFSQADLSSFRMNCLELLSHELDLVILSQIASSTKSSDGSNQTYSQFLHKGHRICIKTFLFLHGVSHHRYENLCRHYSRHGVTPRRHGNLGRSPKHALSLAQTQSIVLFLRNFASVHALPLPGRVPGNFDERYVLLPSDMSKRFVYRKYEEACSLEKCVSRRKFETIWSETVPFIVTAKPSTDLCFTCQQNSRLIMKSANLPEHVKSERVEKALEHLDRAHKEREFYRQKCNSGALAWEAFCSGSSSDLQEMHYSYDYAQQLHYPVNAQQAGPEYFKTARKCNLFGVCCEPRSYQVNYLIDEADDIGKGADATVSMLHHFFENHSLKEMNAHLHADNCAAQNKNNANIHYLLWRVLTGRHKSLTLSFMLAGHKKFAPDRFFGLIKRKYRRSTVSSMIELERVVSESTIAGQNIPQPVRDMHGKQLVVW